jgi:hypothetical protein
VTTIRADAIVKVSGCSLASYEYQRVDNKMNRKEKIGYIWDYYKFWIIGGCGALILLVLILIQTVGIHKDISLQVTMVNADAITVDNSKLFDTYEKEYCDSKFEKIQVEATLKLKKNDTGTFSGSSYQVLSAEFLSGQIDTFISDRETFDFLAANNTFANLEDKLSKEDLAKYKPYFVYEKDAKTGKDYPVGISLTNCPKFAKEKFYQNEAVIGIGALSSQSDNAIQMIAYLFQN